MNRLTTFAAGAVAGAAALALWLGWLGLTEDADRPLR